MSVTGFLQLLAGLWLVAGAAGQGFGGDDFANNLFSDLAPILSLFGERVTMQFMSQSMGWADNVILAMVPLGIMTAVVGAIRVGGPTWLKALIGRARESRAVVESELMSSTSHEVCELWNGQQIVRIMGEGDIREFIILVGEDSDSTPDDEAEDILGGEHSSRPASADAQDNESFDEEAYEAVDPESNEDHYVEDDEGYDAEDDEGHDTQHSEGFDDENDDGPNGEGRVASNVEPDEGFDDEDDGGFNGEGRVASDVEPDEGFEVDDNDGSDVEDGEGFQCDIEGNDAVDVQHAEVFDVDNNEGSDAEDGQGFDAERKESFDVQHDEVFDVNDSVGSGAEDNKEEDAGINSAAKVEIMELRDDEKKRHLAEYRPSTWDVILGRFAPRRKGLVTKDGIPTMFGARKRARAADIERSIPAGDPDDISKRPVAVLRNTGVPSPNMSLNVGNTTTSRETYVVAVFGTLLQTSLLVYAGLTATYLRDNTQFQESPPDGYAFPCMVVGTLMLVPGMLICGHVVENSTSERRYRATGGKEARVVWLQRFGIVNDQSFKSFAIFPTKAQRTIVTSQRSRQERYPTSDDQSVGTTVEVTTTVATALTMCGFILQFVGLRGMNWTVPVAQLAAILLMAVLRSFIRRNLAERPNSRSLPPEHELDWLAITIADPSNAPWLHPNSRVWDGEGHDTHTRPRTEHDRWDYQIVNVQHPNNTVPGGPAGLRKSRAHQAMLIRRDLGRLAGWRGPASEEAVGLACAIEVVLETMLGNGFSAGATFSWHLTSSSCGVHEPVVFRATWKGGSWKACPDDIEAALSLWLYSVHHREKRKEEEAAHGAGRRFAGTTKSRSKRAQENRGLIMMGSFDARVLRRDLSLWLPGQSYQHIRLVFKLEAKEGDSEADPEYDETTDTHRIVGFAQNASNHPPMDIDACTYGNGGMVYKESTLAVYPTIDLKKLYAHHMFTAFMWAVAAKASERYPSFKGVDLFGSEVEIRSFIGPEPEYWRVQPTDQLSNERLSTLASKVETTGVLGPTENIYYAILPPLSAWDLLPPVHAILKRGLEIAHKWEQRGDWRKASITCVELFEKTSLFPRDNSTDVASEATALVMELLRVLTETINFRKGQVVNDDSKIHQLVDSAKWASARVAADNDAAIFPRLMGLYERQGRLWKCDLVGDISTYPTTMPGEFGFEKLHQAACDDDVPEKQRHDHQTKRTVNNQDFLGWAPMHYSVAHGSHGVLGYVLRRGANVNIQDVRRRTPLHYAYRHDDDKMVGRLLRAGADVNASDAGGMTPLHYAAKHGAAKVAAALIEGGANINVVDHGGRTPLAWAVWGGHAELAKNHLWDPTSKIQSDSYGRTPLHMAVTSEEGLGKDFGDMFGFLVPTIDMEVKDKRGYTPLHVAAIKGHLSAVQWLSANGANVHAKEAGWYYSRRRTWGFDLVNPGLTPLYLAKLMLKRARKKREIPLDILDEEYDESRFWGMAGGWESDYSAWYEGDSDIDETGRMVRGYKRRYHLQPGPDAIKGLEDVIRFLMQFDEVCEEERNEMDLQVGSDDNSDEKKSDEEKGDEDKSDDEKSDEEKNGEEGYVEDGDGEEWNAGDGDGRV